MNRITSLSILLSFIFCFAISPLFPQGTDSDGNLEMRVLEEENKELKRQVKEKEMASKVFRIKKEAAELQEEGNKKVKESSIAEKEELQRRWYEKKERAKRLRKNFFYPGYGYLQVEENKKGLLATGFFTLFLFGGIHFLNEANSSLSHANSNKLIPWEYTKSYSEYESSYRAANVLFILGIVTYSLVMYDSFHSAEDDEQKTGVRTHIGMTPVRNHSVHRLDGSSLSAMPQSEMNASISLYLRF